MTRAVVMDRVRRALGRANGAPTPTPPALPEPPQTAPVDDLVRRFQRELEAVSGTFIDARAGWIGPLRRLLGEQGIEGLLVGPGVDLEDIEVPAVDAEHAANDPEPVAGIALAEAGIAEAGSVLVSADGSHAASMLPATSIILLPEGRLIGRLDDLEPADPEGRAATLITGPSRTADIEKKVVLGAHGPRRLIVLLVG